MPFLSVACIYLAPVCGANEPSARGVRGVLELVPTVRTRIRASPMEINPTSVVTPHGRTRIISQKRQRSWVRHDARCPTLLFKIEPHQLIVGAVICHHQPPTALRNRAVENGGRRK
jgi:hypothetical protein